MSSDLAFATASALSARYLKGSLKPSQVVDVLLDRIERLDPKLNSYVTVYPDEARALARAADAMYAAGHVLGPLHGVPVALKDLTEIEGRITTGGCKEWSGRRSGVTATLARNLMAAGAIVIGKTHTVEFAMGGWGTNQHMGTPWNPWDLKTPRTPGGSSSGSGVAVAAGLAPLALGTDTGGSVRLPAAWCGHAGLKVTIGRISVHGVLPLSGTLDSPGPMARSVTDCALMYMAMQGHDPLDPKTLQVPPAIDPLPMLERGVKGLRLATMPASERAGVDPEVLAAYDASIETYRSLGAEIVSVDLPHSFAALAGTVGRIIGAEGYANVGHMVDDAALAIDEAVRPRIWIGKDMPARDYIHTLAEQKRIKAEFDAALADVDALLTPATLTPAIPVDSIDQSTSPAHFTRPFNLVERCAAVVPNGFTASGLPTSLQIVCAPFREDLALRVARAFEKATDFGGRMPPGLD